MMEDSHESDPAAGQDPEGGSLSHASSEDAAAGQEPESDNLPNDASSDPESWDDFVIPAAAGLDWNARHKTYREPWAKSPIDIAFAPAVSENNGARLRRAFECTAVPLREDWLKSLSVTVGGLQHPPLECAARFRAHQCVAVLLEMRADPNRPSVSRYDFLPPLFSALSQRGHPFVEEDCSARGARRQLQCVRMLLEAKADATAQGSWCSWSDDERSPPWTKTVWERAQANEHLSRDIFALLQQWTCAKCHATLAPGPPADHRYCSLVCKFPACAQCGKDRPQKWEYAWHAQPDWTCSACRGAKCHKCKEPVADSNTRGGAFVYCSDECRYPPCDYGCGAKRARTSSYAFHNKETWTCRKCLQGSG